jgi:hypothetical protein
MHKNSKPATTQFQLFLARPSEPPLPANVSPRLLHLLVKLLRGAAEGRKIGRRILDGSHE